jgi:hypothetical protein
MYKSLFVFVFICVLYHSCNKEDFELQAVDPALSDVSNIETACQTAVYDDWVTSEHVLPYPVGETYRVDLSQCTGSFHGPGEPDQFAVDFAMDIGSQITATRAGTVVHIEQSGQDFGFPNNIVVVYTGDTYDQYMHLTQGGAAVTVGQNVAQGQLIGSSGATGLAGYPHLHFVVTSNEGWEYPYESVPHNYRNTTSNERGPESGGVYNALPY